MKPLLAQLLDGQPLDRDQAVEAFEQIMTGAASPPQTAALLALIQQRGATVDELVGAASVMRDKATKVAVPAGLTAIDIVGTGGDHAGTFNISTATALVTAAAGRPHDLVVAKHGNRAVTSKSGSSQVLEALGVTLTADGDALTQCLDEAGICFCFAPNHHPAMKHAGPIRAELGFRTIFNLVGPLTNPAGVRRILMGVWSGALCEPLAHVLAQLGTDRAMVVNGQIPAQEDGHIDGFDELSTCGPTHIAHVDGLNVELDQLDPTKLGLPYAHPSTLRVESPDESAKLIRTIFANEETGPPRDIVQLNTAAALVVGGRATDLAEGLNLAAEALDSGAAQKTLDTLAKLTA
ncbi:MAG: anthranilate phosphoribosyltransferase [Planctomycetota bacterium]